MSYFMHRFWMAHPSLLEVFSSIQRAPLPDSGSQNCTDGI
jgi:hypothetical protein